MYEGSSNCVRVENQHTEWFDITTGVRQGDVLSPVLFNIVIDWIMRKVDMNTNGGIQWKNNTRLKDIEYADDVCLGASNVDQMVELTNSLATEAKKVGLEVNINKSKVMRFHIEDDSDILLEGEALENVDHFSYLGSELNTNGDIRRELNIRIGKAGITFKRLQKVWSNTGISTRLKIRLFNSLVLPVLLYGSETWKGLKEVEERLRRFESNCLRKIMKIRWYDHISEEELRLRSGQESVVKKLGRNRWRYLGHVLRMDDSRLAKQVLGWKPDGRRRVGRPKETWRRTLERDIRLHGTNWNELEDLAQDRKQWRTITDLWAT